MSCALLEPVPDEEDHGDALPQLVRTGAGAGSVPEREEERERKEKRDQGRGGR